jgi:hypothetical protein
MSSIIIFSTIGLIFIIFGAIILSYSKQVVEVRERYDDVGDCKDTNWKNSPKTCTIKFEVDEKMAEPVFFYYELRNYF